MKKSPSALAFFPMRANRPFTVKIVSFIYYCILIEKPETSGKLPDKSTGDIASDEYHKYKVYMHAVDALFLTFSG